MQGFVVYICIINEGVVKMYSDEDIKLMYERNIDMLYRICYTYFKGDKSKIEDVIQDIYLRVIDKNIGFESLEHEKAWFIVSARNACKNVLKRKWNNDIELNFDYCDSNMNENILDLVLNLPEKYKLIIYLHYYEGYSCVEIGKILKMPENTVYSYLNRGRKMLRIELEEE